MHCSRQSPAHAENRLDSPVDVVEGRAAGRDHQRLPERRDVPEQRGVGEVARCDLVCRDVELREHVRARLVERRREEHEAEAPSLVAKLDVGVAVESSASRWALYVRPKLFSLSYGLS